MTNKIQILDNKYSIFTTDNQNLFSAIRGMLSYKIVGAEYSAAFQNGYWNGIEYLLSKKGHVSTALVPRIKQYLRNRNMTWEEIDKRPLIILAPELDISTKLKKIGMVPREHQERVLQATVNNSFGIIRVATGGGKTMAAAMITAKFNKPTTIFVIGLDLLQQFHDLFSQIFDEPIGYIGNGVCQIERINIATIWSVASALKLDKKTVLSEGEDGGEKKLEDGKCEQVKAMLKQSKINLVDECQIIGTATIQAIYDVLEPEKLFGMSGTPLKGEPQDLVSHSILGEIIVNVNASELIEKKLLAQPTIKFLSVPKIKIQSGSTYQAVYKEAIVENKARNEMIIKATKTLIEKGYTPLVLFKQIRHGEILAEMLEDSMVNFRMLRGLNDLEERMKVKQMLINKEIDCILASTIFDIGIDIKELSALVLTSGGSASGRTLQRVGRVIRSFPGKTNAAIIDFYDQVKYLKDHSKIRHETYCSEAGFKVIPSKEMKDKSKYGK